MQLLINNENPSQAVRIEEELPPNIPRSMALYDGHFEFPTLQT